MSRKFLSALFPLLTMLVLKYEISTTVPNPYTCSFVTKPRIRLLK